MVVVITKMMCGIPMNDDDDYYFHQYVLFVLLKLQSSPPQLLRIKVRSLHLMEALVKDLTSRESFDMRLEQFLLEYPQWSSYGRDDRDEVDSEESTYTIYIDNCDDEKVLDRLADPRYYLSSRVCCDYVYIDDNNVGTTKCVAVLELQFEEDVDDYEGE